MSSTHGRSTASGPSWRKSSYRGRPMVGASRKNAASVATKALREVRKLAVSRELKRLDLSLSNADCLGFSLNGLITNIAPIAQGLTSSDRVGNDIRLKRFRAVIAMNTATASNFCWRWVVVKDKQTRNSYTPSVAEIFTSARTTADIIEAQRERYTILYDKIFDQNTAFAGQDSRISNVIDIPLDHTMEFSGASSTSFQKGNVYLICMCELGSTTQYTSLVGGEAFAGYFTSTSYTDS